MIEQLDYSVTVPSVNGLETVNYFVDHPVYGTVGYPTYEDAENDMHGVLGIGQFLDSVESFINAGFIGDHYVFNADNMIVEIISEFESWTWTPETGVVYDPKPEPENRPNRKQRRSARRVQNARHKQSDRKHGKRHGKKYLDSLPRKKHLEADNYDHPTFRVEKGKPRPIHNVKCARETAKLRDALDVSPVERLTASVLAHMSNHVFMWDEQVVWDLTEALCEEYRQVFPDDSYVCVYGNHVNLYMQYMDENGVLQDEQCYTLR